ncbi:MAG: tRNA (cytidine(34)-2'-O)-methyltransferase [Acidiferrobacterales bacterium]|nr:tRNA (cytidine(34)-2'-O)-methyltransferase [Acidiferrobacterales bacterium]
MFNVVLVSPQIPPNTGNIIRLCANSGCRLHLIEPLGFELEDSKLRRAGLDYREWVDVRVHPTYSDFTDIHGNSRNFTFSKFHSNVYTGVDYAPHDNLIFGSELSGLPEFVKSGVDPAHRLRLPMLPDNRSLNLSNAVAIVVYEAWRQNGFAMNVPDCVSD